jgi:hypothetical protein
MIYFIFKVTFNQNKEGTDQWDSKFHNSNSYNFIIYFTESEVSSLGYRILTGATMKYKSVALLFVIQLL